MKTLHFSPRFSQGPDWLRAALAPGSGSGGYSAARARSMSVVAGPPAWAAPGAEPGLPHTRTAAAHPLARPHSRRPGEGVLFWIQRTRTAATAAATARAAPAASSPPSSHPWVKGIFPPQRGERPRRRRRGWCRW